MRRNFITVIAALIGAVFSLDTVLNTGENGNMCFAFKNCSCFKGKEYEIQCPFMTNLGVVITLLQDKYIKIDCHIASDYILETVPDVNFPVNVELFKVRFCQLPLYKFQYMLKKFGISQIKRLYLEGCELGNNSLSQIDQSFFEGLMSLESLTISSTSKRFSDNVFENLPNLVELYVEQNNLTEIGYLFEKNLQLRVLHLSRNALSQLPTGVFSKLNDLQQLHLWKNYLTNVTKDYFLGLHSLKSLELSSNSINFLELSAFSELTELVNISLKSNKLGLIESNTFKYNLKLENVKLGVNPNLILNDYVFANLTNLKSINMDHCYLKEIPLHLFENCTSLTSLEMQNNLLRSLPQNVFRTLKKLYTLDLSSNKLISLSDNVFAPLENLIELNLGNNQLTILTKNVLEGLNKLESLVLRNNKISSIDNNAFSTPTKLKTLDLSNNMLMDKTLDQNKLLSFSSKFSNLKELEELFLSYNKIFEFPEEVLYSSVNLKVLNLSHNKIYTISIRSLVKASNYNVEVNLSSNNISYIDFDQAELVATANTQAIIQADAYHNSNFTTTDVIVTDNPLVCDCHNFDLLQYLRGNMNPAIKLIANIIVKDTKCYEPKIFNHISIKDLDPRKISCKYRGNDCPHPCNCFVRSYDKALVVDCSLKNLTDLPNLTLKQNRLEVNLIGNLLNKGPTEGQGYDMVRNLFLSNNKIKSFDWCPPHIENLKLDQNQLNSLDNEVLKTLNVSTNFINLSLGSNPWACGCSALELQNFLKSHFEKVQINDVVCETDNISLVEKKLVCKSKAAVIAQIVIPILVIFLITSTLMALYFRYKQEIKIWLFSKNFCLWLVTEEELDKDKKYDIFLSFSHKDEDFVAENLVPSLEKSFKLCIHSRDWVPGELINDQIVDSVYNSRRTLVVLSDNFLESAWGKLEFLMAHKQSVEEGRTRVIVIKLGQLNADKMTDDFKAYIKTNTYIEWGEPWFWKKLLYALPHYNKNPEKRNQRHANMMLKIDDKFQLAAQPITYPDSTPPVISLDTLLKKHPLNFEVPSNINTLSADIPLMKSK